MSELKENMNSHWLLLLPLPFGTCSSYCALAVSQDVFEQLMREKCRVLMSLLQIHLRLTGNKLFAVLSVDFQSKLYPDFVAVRHFRCEWNTISLSVKYEPDRGPLFHISSTL